MLATDLLWRLYILLDVQRRGGMHLFVCVHALLWGEVGEATANSSHMIHPTVEALTLTTAHRHKHTVQEAAPGLANELLHKKWAQSGCLSTLKAHRRYSYY